MQTQGENPGAINGLTDLFAHLSHIEQSSSLVEKMKDPDMATRVAFMRSFLDAYPHLPQVIKDEIIAYVQQPTEKTVEVIAARAAEEVRKMWDILGVC